MQSKKHIIILLFFVLSCTHLKAQGRNNLKFSYAEWHKGKIILVNEDTLKGVLKYDIANDFVQFEFDNKIITLSARQIFYFEFFDSITEKMRYFYSLPFAVVGNYKAPILFEVLAEGQLTLLAREYITVENIPVYTNAYRLAHVSTPRIKNHYFLVETQQGEIKRFNKKRAELFRYVEKYKDEIENYILLNRFSMENKKDLSLIVSYYNELYERNEE